MGDIILYEENGKVKLKATDNQVIEYNASLNSINCDAIQCSNCPFDTGTYGCALSVITHGLRDIIDNTEK